MNHQLVRACGGQLSRPKVGLNPVVVDDLIQAMLHPVHK